MLEVAYLVKVVYCRVNGLLDFLCVVLSYRNPHFALSSRGGSAIDHVCNFPYVTEPGTRVRQYNILRLRHYMPHVSHCLTLLTGKIPDILRESSYCPLRLLLALLICECVLTNRRPVLGLALLECCRHFPSCHLRCKFLACHCSLLLSRR